MRPLLPQAVMGTPGVDGPNTTTNHVMEVQVGPLPQLLPALQYITVLCRCYSYYIFHTFSVRLSLELLAVGSPLGTVPCPWEGGRNGEDLPALR